MTVEQKGLMKQAFIQMVSEHDHEGHFRSHGISMAVLQCLQKLKSAALECRWSFMMFFVSTALRH